MICSAWCYLRVFSSHHASWIYIPNLLYHLVQFFFSDVVNLMQFIVLSLWPLLFFRICVILYRSNVFCASFRFPFHSTQSLSSNFFVLLFLQRLVVQKLFYAQKLLNWIIWTDTVWSFYYTHCKIQNTNTAMIVYSSCNLLLCSDDQSQLFCCAGVLLIRPWRCKWWELKTHQSF